MDLKFLELMEQMGVKNPKMRKLAEIMAQQNNHAAAADSEKETLNEHAPAQQEIIRLRKVIHLLKKGHNDLIKKNKYLAENLEFRLGINDLLAEALGACQVCWGMSGDCRKCGGAGSPGTYERDEEAFLEMVLPAVKKHDREHLRPPKKST